jgi:hypothetical protein
MEPGNVWLEGRQRETAALDAIITALTRKSGPVRQAAAAGGGAVG